MQNLNKNGGGQDWLARFAPLLVVCLPTLLFQYLYVNAFYPITEGWFSEFARLIREGQAPYKDFNLLTPPLYPLQIAGFQVLFGENLIALHWLGMIITCAIAIALFDMLKGLTNVWAAAIAASFGILHYQSGNAFLGYDYTQFLTLDLLIAAACLMRLVGGRYTRSCAKVPYLLYFGAGFFMASAVLTKQSNGGVAVLFLGLITLLVILKQQSWRLAFKYLAVIALGFAVPVVAIGGWLAVTGALPAFIDSITVQALASKGGVDSTTVKWLREFFVWGPYLGTARIMLLRLAALLVVMVLVSFVTQLLVSFFGSTRINFQKMMLASRQRANNGCGLLLALVATAALCALIVAIYQKQCTICDPHHYGAFLYDKNFVWSSSLYIIGFIFSLLRFLYKPQGKGGIFVVFFGFGLSLMFGNGTSAGLSEISMFLGVSLLWAALLSLGLPQFLPALLPLGLMLCFTSNFIVTKFATPYHWWQVTVPDARAQDCAASEGVLSGLCIPPDQYAGIAKIAHDVETHSKPGDALYVFPHLPVFNLITHRPPFAGAVISWFDFMSDQQADALDAALQKNPPPVIIVARLDEIVFKEHERLFRHGKELSQRHILATIAALEQNHVLKRIDTVENLNGLTVDVYARLKPQGFAQ